jgi:hypothetical protein
MSAHMIEQGETRPIIAASLRLSMYWRAPLQIFLNHAIPFIHHVRRRGNRRNQQAIMEHDNVNRSEQSIRPKYVMDTAPISGLHR